MFQSPRFGQDMPGGSLGDEHAGRRVHSVVGKAKIHGVDARPENPPQSGGVCGPAPVGHPRRSAWTFPGTLPGVSLPTVALLVPGSTRKPSVVWVRRSPVCSGAAGPVRRDRRSGATVRQPGEVRRRVRTLGGRLGQRRRRKALLRTARLGGTRTRAEGQPFPSAGTHKRHRSSGLRLAGVTGAVHVPDDRLPRRQEALNCRSPPPLPSGQTIRAEQAQNPVEAGQSHNPGKVSAGIDSDGGENSGSLHSYHPFPFTNKGSLAVPGDRTTSPCDRTPHLHHADAPPRRDTPAVASPPAV